MKQTEMALPLVETPIDYSDLSSNNEDNFIFAEKGRFVNYDCCQNE